MNCKECGSKNISKKVMEKLSTGTLVDLNLDRKDYKFDFESLKFSNGPSLVVFKKCSACDKKIDRNKLFSSDFNKCSCGSHVGFLEEYQFKRKQGKNIVILHGKCSNCGGNIRGVATTDMSLSKRLNPKNWL